MTTNATWVSMNQALCGVAGMFAPVWSHLLRCYLWPWWISRTSCSSWTLSGQQNTYSIWMLSLYTISLSPLQDTGSKKTCIPTRPKSSPPLLHLSEQPPFSDIHVLRKLGDEWVIFESLFYWVSDIFSSGQTRGKKRQTKLWSQQG